MQQLQDLNNQLESAETTITDLGAISPEAFAEWKANPVTQLLYLHVRQAQVDAAMQAITDANQRHRAHIEAFETVLEWNPAEVVEEVVNV